jgi:hypothetical protein
MLHHNLAEENDARALGKGRLLGVSSLFVVSISVLYPLLMIAYSFLGGVVIQLSASLAGASVFVVMFFKKTRMSEGKKLVMVFMVSSLILCGWFGALWTDMRSYGVVLMLLSCLGVAWATLEFRLSRFVYEYPFYIFLTITGGLIVVGVDQHEFNKILAVGSRNVYSAILLAFAIGYLFSRKIRGKATSITLAVVLVVVSFFLYSRTGLVLAFALFFMFVIGSGLVRPWLIAVGSLLVLLLFLVLFDAGDFFTRHSNFEKGLNSPRFAIWKSYLFDVEAFNLFFGYNLNSNKFIGEYGGNPHSAYLRLHSYFGVGLFFLLFFSLLSVLSIISGKRWFFAVLLCCFYFRAAFDPVYFIWVFDYIFYPFVFFIFFGPYCLVVDEKNN